MLRERERAESKIELYGETKLGSSACVIRIEAKS